MNNPDSKKGVGLIFTGGFILTIVIVAGLAFLQHALQAVDAIGGVKLGLFVSVLFSSTAIGINYLYLKKPFMLFVIDCGYHIVSCIIAGIILAAWH